MGLPERYSLTVPARDVRSAPPAVNPNLILILRFLLTALVCGLALATTIMCLLVVVYYNSNDPIVRPSWGSLIFLIVLGFFTCIIYFGYNIFLPLMPFIKYGDFLYSIFMVKIELVLQFAMCVLWVSGALAYASDLRGYENCQFDGYLHYTEPDDFRHVCDLINWAVPLAYATFGVQVLLWALETTFGLYLFLFLDQDSLNEPHFTWGRRAFDWKRSAKQQLALQQSNNGPTNYRARAVSAPTGGAGAAGLGAGYAAGRGGGRRGSAYREDGDSERYSDRTLSATELREEDEDGYTEGVTEMTETQMGDDRPRRPLSLGKRGKRGYNDEESGYGRSRSSQSQRSISEGTGRGYRRNYDEDQEPMGYYPHENRRRGSLGRGPGVQTDEESTGWHLRQ